MDQRARNANAREKVFNLLVRRAAAGNNNKIGVKAHVAGKIVVATKARYLLAKEQKQALAVKRYAGHTGPILVGEEEITRAGNSWKKPIKSTYLNTRAPNSSQFHNL